MAAIPLILLGQLMAPDKRYYGRFRGLLVKIDETRKSRIVLKMKNVLRCLIDYLITFRCGVDCGVDLL